MMDIIISEENVRELITKKNADDQLLNRKQYKKKRPINISNRQTKNIEIFNKQSTRENVGCSLSKSKSPVPKFKDLIRANNFNDRRKDKNFVALNIHSVKNISSIEKLPITQDSCNGHCQNIERAGLQPKYVFKKEYGKTPSYIRQNRIVQMKEQGEMQHESREKQVEQSWHHVDEEEKQTVLKGLKENLAEIERRLFALPMITDTLSKIRKKLSLEQQATKLQNDIDMLENNDIIVIND